jgi:hypothetical protein
MNIKLVLAAAAALLALLATSAPAYAGSRESGCIDGVTIKHWWQPVEYFFSGPKIPLTIEGKAGSYKEDFLAFLEKDKSWGLTEDGKYIGKHLVPGEGQKWSFSDSAAAITAPTLSVEDGLVLGKVWRKYISLGLGIAGVFDQNRFPPHNWIEVSGKKYLIRDRAAESDSNLVVLLEPGIYNGPDVTKETVCFIPAP